MDVTALAVAILADPHPGDAPAAFRYPVTRQFKEASRRPSRPTVRDSSLFPMDGEEAIERQTNGRRMFRRRDDVGRLCE